MSRMLLAGTTNHSTVIRIIDSTDGTPETGVVAATAGLAFNFRRTASATVVITGLSNLALLTTAHTDGGILHIGNGYYRLDFQDAAFASGATDVLLTGTATGMVVIGELYELVLFDPQDAVRLGLTALPNAAADAAGGLPISDAGGLDLDARLDAAVTSRLAPTVAGRTLDITAAGEAGIDLDNTSGTIAAAQIATDAITAAKIEADAIGSSEFAASAAQKIRDEILPTQNVAFPNLMFLFVAASDHVTPVTAASGTGVTRSIDAGAFGAGTGTLAEVANGIYQYDASAADMNGGIITFRFTASGGTPGAPDDRFITIVTGGGV